MHHTPPIICNDSSSDDSSDDSSDSSSGSDSSDDSGVDVKPNIDLSTSDEGWKLLIPEFKHLLRNISFKEVFQLTHRHGSHFSFVLLKRFTSA